MLRGRPGDRRVRRPRGAPSTVSARATPGTTCGRRLVRQQRARSRAPPAAAGCRRAAGTEAWPARPKKRSRSELTSFSPTEIVTTRRPSASSSSDPAALVEGEVAAQVGALADQPGHADVGGVALLVGLGDQQRRRRPARSPERAKRRERDRARRQLALHVGGAAADQPAVAIAALERRHAPAARAAPGRRRCGRGAAIEGPSPLPSIRATRLSRAGVGAGQLALDAGAGEVAGEQLGRRRLAARAGSRCRSGSARGQSADDLLPQRRSRGASLSGARPPARRGDGSTGNALLHRAVAARRRAGREQAVVDGLVGGLVGGGEERFELVAGDARRGRAGRVGRRRGRSRPSPRRRRSPPAPARAAAAAPAAAAAAGRAARRWRRPRCRSPSRLARLGRGSSRVPSRSRYSRSPKLQSSRTPTWCSPSQPRGGADPAGEVEAGHPGAGADRALGDLLAERGERRARRRPPTTVRESAMLAVVALADDRDDDVVGAAPGGARPPPGSRSRARACRRGRPASRSRRARRSRVLPISSPVPLTVAVPAGAGSAGGATTVTPVALAARRLGVADAAPRGRR